MKAVNKGHKTGATRKKQPRKAVSFRFPKVSIPSSFWLVSGIVVFLIAGVGLLSFGMDRVSWPISDVKFEQVLIYQDSEQFEALITAQVGKNLMRDSIFEIKQEIESLPWIASAEIRLIWPGILNVEVVEERPVAVWNNEQLISQTGKLFKADNADFKLPFLYGNDQRLEMVMSHYLNFNRSLLGFGQIIQELRLSAGGSWTIETEDGFTIKLGGNEVLARFQRSLVFIESITTNVKNIEYIDARYNNGIAYKLNKSDGDTSA